MDLFVMIERSVSHSCDNKQRKKAFLIEPSPGTFIATNQKPIKHLWWTFQRI